MEKGLIQWHPAFCQRRLYKVSGKCVDDITLSMMRKSRPDKLLRIFGVMGYVLTNPWPGSYYVNKEGFI